MPATAAWINEVLDGRRPVPQAIAEQVDHRKCGCTRGPLMACCVDDLLQLLPPSGKLTPDRLRARPPALVPVRTHLVM
jgi:hypothetical protein